jgi:hypothetical protein
VTVTANVTGLHGATAYRYTLVATTGAGSAASASSDFTTPADTSAPAPGVSAPSLTALKLRPSRFRVAAHRGRVGTTIAFTLSRDSRVTISFERRTASGGFKKVRGAVRVTRPAGRTQLRFNGTVAGRKLAPGRYRVSAVASDATGRASKVRHAKATVLR